MNPNSHRQNEIESSIWAIGLACMFTALTVGMLNWGANALVDWIEPLPERSTNSTHLPGIDCRAEIEAMQSAGLYDVHIEGCHPPIDDGIVIVEHNPLP